MRALLDLPPGLLEFQLTLRPPAGTTAVELLAAADAYANQDPPPVGAVHRAVPLRESAGWRLTADLYVPAGPPPFPTLLFLHGGAWVTGSPWTHRRLAAELAALGLLTVSLDYRRAPKHRFPAAVADCSFALDWAAERAGSYGGDPSRLLVGGDSAGGNLAAAVLATGAAASAATVRAALLLYGIFDYHRALPTLSALVGGPDAGSQAYLVPADADALRGDPAVSPEARCGHFPPTLLLTGGRDPLLPESVAMAGRLAGHHLAHQLVVLPDAPHGFLQLPTHPSYARGLREIGGFLHARDLLPAP